VIAEIRKITDKPVKYLVIHTGIGITGLERRLTKRRFRACRLFREERERPDHAGTVAGVQQHFLEEDLPGYVGSLKKKLAEEEAKTPAPAGFLEEAEAFVRSGPFFVEQKSHAR